MLPSARYARMLPGVWFGPNSLVWAVVGLFDTLLDTISRCFMCQVTKGLFSLESESHEKSEGGTFTCTTSTQPLLLH